MEKDFWGKDKMGLGKTKWILFKFLPYEYRTLEKYLEKMALEGW